MVTKIKFQNSQNNYSILIGKKILNFLPKEIKKINPKTKKIAIIYDNNVPRIYQKIFKKNLKEYSLIFLPFVASEKAKSLNTASRYLNKLSSLKFNRSDLIISVGGGITGDVFGFVASIYKRGINFINIPTTLLAQVDSAIGGKTAVNSKYGKNLIGSFYQPKLVISDISFLKSLPKKELICGYAEILKHAIIKDKKFFEWLRKNKIRSLFNNRKKMSYIIKKSCEIKIHFVKKDTNEKNLRMSLNFGHSLAHAIEISNKFSKKISHGEAVLSGMILEARLSLIRKICKLETLRKIYEIYRKNNLSYTYERFNKSRAIKNLIPFLKNDKKNNDDKINFILLKKIGLVDKPNKNKISLKNFKNYVETLIQY